jgi:RNA polymerase II C-terminal domain phosphatase-like 3/4
LFWSITTHYFDCSTTAQFVEVEEEWEAKLRANEMTERAKFAKEGNKRELYRFPHMGMWTKLRPGIWNFLARVKRDHV